LIINSLTALASIFLGFALGFVGFILQQKLKRDLAHAELMRGLSTEVGSNRVKCEITKTPSGIPSLLETACWDRIRYSDCLYWCITSRDESIYEQLLKVYSYMGTVNFSITRYFSAIDGNTRSPTTDNQIALTATRTMTQTTAELILPHLKDLENSLGVFLLREGFSGKDKKGKKMTKTVKKLIAREGLVIIAIVGIGLIIIGLAFVVYLIYETQIAKDSFIPDTLSFFVNTLAVIGGAIAVLGYPLYLLIRFILWAVRTIREK